MDAHAPGTDDVALLEGLRLGDEAAFAALLRRYQAPMLRLALMYVQSREAAEDVLQETWIGVVRGAERFEGRSSVKTWLFRILVNRAKSKGVAERRHVPVPDLAGGDPGDGPAVGPERFSSGAWSVPPTPWEGLPEERLLSGEVRRLIDEAVGRLPAQQREVITLRDLQGLTSAEACQILGISEANQRVLLHRARSKVRASLEGYLTPAGG